MSAGDDNARLTVRPLSALDEVILTDLRKHGESYCVEVAKRLGMAGRSQHRIKGRLVALEEQGLLTSRKVAAADCPGSKSGLGRRYYRIAGSQ